MRYSLILLPPHTVHRHGYILALSHCIQGLLAAGFVCDEKIINHATDLPWILRAESEKLKVSGGELTRRALAAFIHCLSSVPVKLTLDNVEKWLDRLLLFACDDTAAVRKVAALAASTFFPAYFSTPVSGSADSRVDSISSKIVAARREHERIGLCSVVAFLPQRFVTSPLLEAICNVIIKRTELDAKWALARQSAVDALGEFFTQRPSDAWVPSLFDALFHGIDDYTTDCHGDIGRFVRMSSMYVMTKVLTVPSLDETVVEEYAQRVVQHMVQQSVGKIGRIRELMERFLCTVADLFDVGRKTPRIGDSVLRLLPQILSCLHVLEMCPDSSPALSRLLLQLTKIVNSRLSSPARIKSSLNSLCSLLGCSRESQTWHSAARLIVRSLSSALPVIRRAAAEGLYESVCLTDVDEQGGKWFGVMSKDDEAIVRSMATEKGKKRHKPQRGGINRGPQGFRHPIRPASDSGLSRYASAQGRQFREDRPSLTNFHTKARGPQIPPRFGFGNASYTARSETESLKSGYSSSSEENRDPDYPAECDPRLSRSSSVRRSISGDHQSRPGVRAASTSLSPPPGLESVKEQSRPSTPVPPSSCRVGVLSDFDC
ncbi:unnamed protein product [Heligmosomoides polygyrus]|uniref:NUC173 domain-containing protein n=1 Tax=Heligmosomoides polygyrus TaxID=6339 RepID=A0A183F2U0_HELPZ|nr:unnamed protein product [Heligmosomoides polygyrus]